MFARTLNTKNEYLRVLIYINIRILRLCFSLRKDIFNYRDTNLVFFFKVWWNNEYSRDLTIYCAFRNKIDWIKYKKIVKIAK